MYWGIHYLYKLLIILYIIHFTPQLQVDVSCTLKLNFHSPSEQGGTHAADWAERLRPGVIWVNPLKRFEISATVSVSPRKRSI
jgi:hypothetical protein